MNFKEFLKEYKVIKGFTWAEMDKFFGIDLSNYRKKNIVPSPQGFKKMAKKIKEKKHINLARLAIINTIEARYNF